MSRFMLLSYHHPVYKKVFYKRFFNSVKENLVVTRGQLYDLEEVSEGYKEEKRSTTKSVMLCKSIA